MDMVCEHLNLLEKDYFGLTFADTDTQKVSVFVFFLEIYITVTSLGTFQCINMRGSENDLYSSRSLAGSPLSRVHYPSFKDEWKMEISTLESGQEAIEKLVQFEKR